MNGHPQPKSNKTRNGRRSPAPQIPVAIRSNLQLDPMLRLRLREYCEAALVRVAPAVERATVRLSATRSTAPNLTSEVTLLFNGMPSVTASESGIDPEECVQRTVSEILELMLGETGGEYKIDSQELERRAAARADAGSLIGRRVGRSRVNLELALARPEKTRRDAYVDTAKPGQSASARRAGGPFSARRNAKASADGMANALEDSRTKPSRKSTRGSSAAHLKAATQLTRRTQRAIHTAQARAERAQVRRG